MLRALATFPLPTAAELRTMAAQTTGASFMAFLVGGSSVYLPIVMPYAKVLSATVRGML